MARPSMKSVLEKAGLSLLRAYGAAALTYAPGILAAPNLNAARLLAAAAVVGIGAAGFRALQEFVPQLSFVSYLGEQAGGYVDSFARAFLSSFFAALASINAVPNLGAGRNILVAATIGALAAAAKAIHGAADSKT